MIRDRNIEWLRTVHRFLPKDFGWEPSHTHAVATPTVSTTTGSGEGIVGMDDGAPLIAEVSTFGVSGIEIAAAGDSFSVLDLTLPPKIDPEEEIGVRVLWTTNGAVATTDAITWLVTYKQFDVGEALAAASTALSTVIASQSPAATTTLLLKRTGRGKINKNVFDHTFRKGGLIWNVEADVLTGFSANEVVFLGLEIDYIPLLCANRDEKIDVFSSLAAAG